MTKRKRGVVLCNAGQRHPGALELLIGEGRFSGFALGLTRKTLSEVTA